MTRELASTVPWLVRCADRSHAALVPLLWLCGTLLYYGLLYRFAGDSSCCWSSGKELWGGIITYSLLPAYPGFLRDLLLPSISGGVERDSDFVQSHGFGICWVTVARPCSSDLRHGSWHAVWCRSVHRGTAGAAGAGNRAHERLDGRKPGVDVGVVGWLIVYRIHSALVFRQLGARLPIDLYRLTNLRPFAAVAMLDLLIIMGALALAPIQALDAEFRWINYRAGVLVAIPAAAFLFLTPMWGVHGAIVRAKHLRLSELQSALDQCERSDYLRLDALLGHQERVRSLHSWPVDLRLITRVGFYLVIPPLAWIGAALVENLVDTLLG